MKLGEGKKYPPRCRITQKPQTTQSKELHLFISLFCSFKLFALVFVFFSLCVILFVLYFLQFICIKILKVSSNLNTANKCTFTPTKTINERRSLSSQAIEPFIRFKPCHTSIPSYGPDSISDPLGLTCHRFRWWWWLTKSGGGLEQKNSIKDLTLKILNERRMVGIQNFINFLYLISFLRY